MDGVANHLDDLDALRDEDPDRCESNDDVATHLQLGLDRTFPPLSLKMGHQVLQFALRLGFVTNLNGIIRGPSEKTRNLFDVHSLFKDSSVLDELKSDSTRDVVSRNRLNGRPMSEETHVKELKLSPAGTPWFQLWSSQVLYARNLGLKACHLHRNSRFGSKQTRFLPCSPKE